MIVLVVLGCGPADRATETVGPGAFTDYFDVPWQAELLDQGALLADIGTALKTANGDVVLSDNIQQTVRRYTPKGQLVAAFGAFGEGPAEFRRVGGIAEDGSGRIIVVDPRLGRVTRLRPDLRFDTSFVLNPRPRGLAVVFGNALLLSVAQGPRSTGIALMAESWDPVWTVAAPDPGPPTQFPYWDSFASTLVAASPNVIATAYSLRYPIYLHGGSGHINDSITQAPPSFRKASVLERGALAGADAQRQQTKWLASFDVIAALAFFDDSLLAVVHGSLRSTATSRIENNQDRLDVYHVPSRTKLAEDIQLPAESRVLSGGHCLLILLSQPPETWTVACARFRKNPPHP